MWNGTLDAYFNEDGTFDHTLICGDDITQITAIDKPAKTRWQLPLELPPERYKKALVHLEHLILTNYTGYTGNTATNTGGSGTQILVVTA